MSTDPKLRDGAIYQAQQERITRDTLILQKVNAAHREAFKTRFPGQVEHIVRLTAERLHQMLLKKPDDLANPDTWSSTANEIAELSEALYYVYQIHKDIINDQPNTR